ncbi:hypothetical protein OH76DRAFT_1238448 [Lentinus brumalis]|uniref:Uncharacterized protein n=1 Tax=Lentinus brumalis TaxID=2498619 RepID=A0A371CS36_9APHY|nr:hypothetical protein OH76DRAFT_1238448 [Polyporus brumalis]
MHQCDSAHYHIHPHAQSRISDRCVVKHWSDGGAAHHFTSSISSGWMARVLLRFPSVVPGASPACSTHNGNVGCAAFEIGRILGSRLRSHLSPLSSTCPGPVQARSARNAPHWRSFGHACCPLASIRLLLVLLSTYFLGRTTLSPNIHRTSLPFAYSRSARATCRALSQQPSPARCKQAALTIFLHVGTSLALEA